MKSKLNIRKLGDTTVVEYFKLKNSYNFRYRMLSETLLNFGEATIFIDTNSRVKKSEMDLNDYFDQNSVEYKALNINQTEKRMLGVLINSFRKPKPKLTEKFIIAKLTPDIFTRDFFDNYVSDYDIAFGMGAKTSVTDMAEIYRDNTEELFFNNKFFDEFMYDSIIFTSNRSTIDTKELAMLCESRLSSR